MSAHPPVRPPANPPSPTGPGRSHSPGPADAAHSLSSGPGIHPSPCTCGHDRVERLFHLAPCPRSERGDRLPRHLEIVLDIQQLVAQALAIRDRQVDPATCPLGPAAHAADIGFDAVEFYLAAAMRELVKIADLPSPPGRRS